MFGWKLRKFHGHLVNDPQFYRALLGWPVVTNIETVEIDKVPLGHGRVMR